MQIGPYKFDRVEFAGSLGDLGTLIPLAVGLMVINGLSVTAVLLMVGLLYIVSGLYYRLPIPVQPLKVVAAIAIAYPAKITVPVIAASGMIFGIILLIFAITGIIDWLARFFTKSIVRGIQLGLGFILISKGIGLIKRPELFIQKGAILTRIDGLSINLLIGILAFIVVLFLLSSKRFPAALLIVTTGIIIGVSLGALKDVRLVLGPTPVKIFRPSIEEFMNALILLVIPQIPLTIGNAIMGTTDACQTLFGKGEITRRATHRGFSMSMGIGNLITGLIGGMPVCHGAGGLAAHYRFGARTGGSNIMIGAVFLVIAILFGNIGISLLSCIPNAILGVLLLFAGLELALLIMDVREKRDLFVAFLIAGIGLATTNMGIAFFIGIIVAYLMKREEIEI
jgi:SulP family sulfate permease